MKEEIERIAAITIFYLILISVHIIPIYILTNDPFVFIFAAFWICVFTFTFWMVGVFKPLAGDLR